MRNLFSLLAVCFFLVAAATGFCQNETKSNTSSDSAKAEVEAAAGIDGTEQGWVSLGESDFENVNCKEDTWNWNADSLSCKGNCVGVIGSKKEFKNFELVLQWKHLQKAGNSGVFVWTPKSSLTDMKPNSLPEGIECQILDHGYTEQYEKSSGQKADWFSTNGDVFPVGKTKMKPFDPLSPDGVRSFPSANHSKDLGNGTTTTSARSMAKSDCGLMVARCLVETAAIRPEDLFASNQKALQLSFETSRFGCCPNTGQSIGFRVRLPGSQFPVFK